MDLWQLVSGALSGLLVGFTLGLVGGGGSVLAVPLIFYFVGVKNPHLAIGTSAFSVAINAATGLFNHARAGHVVWACGAVFSIFGVLGATLGSTIGKSFDGQKLLFLFALLMVAVGVLMLRRRAVDGDAAVQCTVDKYPRVIGFGLVTGAFSGFFGIGGGFLVVPSLLGATGMTIIHAVGTSLVAVTAFGLTTAINYALSGFVDWSLAAVFVVAGIVGTTLGARTCKHLAASRGALAVVFATMVFLVAGYMLYRSGMSLLGWV